MPSHVMVFSHPNHEVAVLGAIQRLKPQIIFLTDGGGEERVNQTRRGLASYTDPSQLHFLNHREQALYDALLACDAEFYRGIAGQLREIFQPMDIEAVYVDSVEFYNPVHDITLPVVLSALDGRDAALYEVPLIYQETGKGESFAMQCAPAALDDECMQIDLTEGELARKAETLRNGPYGILTSQMGSMIEEALASHGKRERFLKGRRVLPRPVAGQALRYEERGQKLKDRGEIGEVITYNCHYAPIFETLCGYRAAA
ncbi:MAG: hypothetical protein SFW62_05865 [Alphaproteobacteria bacterium]|nr:hypothetical protein [Alphaproteobacteria bacterium]